MTIRKVKLTVQNIAVGVSLKATLASPKSQILSLQSALAKMFFGFKSRWKTFAAKNKMGCFRETKVGNTPAPQFPFSCGSTEVTKV